MEKNNFVLAIRRGAALLAVFSIFAFSLLGVPAFAYSYTNVYPFYLPFVGAKYVEVQCSLGRGALVLSGSIPDNYISIGSNDNNLYNNTSSTLYGTFRTINGHDYSVRFAAFSSAEYYQAGSYNPTYTALNVTEILNTNISFIDYNDSNKQNDTYIFSNHFDLSTWSLSILQVILLICIFLVTAFRRSDRL